MLWKILTFLCFTLLLLSNADDSTDSSADTVTKTEGNADADADANADADADANVDDNDDTSAESSLPPKEITFCAIGLGNFGKAAANLAIAKGFKLVAAFTRFSHRTKDVGDVLGLPAKLGFNVSSVRKMEAVLDATQPDICIDASQGSIEAVYPHIYRVLSKGISVVSIAEQLLYPYSKKSWKIDRLLHTLHKTAQEHNCVLIGTGFPDGPILPAVSGILAGLPSIAKVEIQMRVGSDRKGLTNFQKRMGAGYTPTQYKAHFNQTGKYSRVPAFQLFNEAVVEALAHELGFEIFIKPRPSALHLNDLQLFSRAECIPNDYGREIFSPALDRNVLESECLGTFVTSAGFCANGVMLYARTYFGSLPENGMTFVYHTTSAEGDEDGEEEKPLTVSFNDMDVLATVAATVVHRMATALFVSAPGYYSTRELPTNQYFNTIQEFLNPIPGRVLPPPRVKTETEDEDNEDEEEDPVDATDATDTEAAEETEETEEKGEL